MISTKKELVLNFLEDGYTNTREIFELAASKGTVLDISYINRIKRERSLATRVKNGENLRMPTQPFATDGITNNAVANKYLEQVESEGGGFLKTCVYDIETTGFFADFGYTLTCAVKNIDTGEIKIFRLDQTEWYKDAKKKYEEGEKSNWNSEDFWDVIDIELINHIRAELNKYDLVITYNGKFFDEQFLQTRLLRCGLPALNPGTKHMDIYQLVRKVMKTRSKKLDSIKNFLKIDDEEDTHNWPAWRMAAAGIKEGFDFISDHNIKDVEQLHQVAQRLSNQSKFYFF